jgi:hypothetical protein
MKCTFVISLLLSVNSIFSQPGFGFTEATVSYKKGDSMLCLVKLSLNYGDTVIYKYYDGDSEKMLFSKSIKGIRFPNNYIENVQLDSGREKLSTLIVTGRVCLYSFATITMGKAVAIPKSGGLKLTSGTTTPHFIVKKDSVCKEIREDYFRRDIAPFIRNCPGMLKKLDTEGYYFTDMMKIIKEYNSCELGE